MSDVCLVLHDEQYLRSWQTSGAIRQLAENSTRLTIVCSKSVAELLELPHGAKSQIFDFSSSLFEFWIDRLSWMQSLANNTDFRLKLRRFYFSDELWYRRDLTGPRKAMHFLNAFFSFIARCVRNPLGGIALLSGSWARNIVIKLLERVNERGRKEYWKKIPSADLTIIPSHAQEPWLDSFLRHLAGSEGRSMVVPDNWDNLTAKIRFRVLPNYISVYGKSSSVQAKCLHGFSDKQIVELGAPRFNVYFPKPKTQGKTGTVKTVAYLGYFQKHDELKQLKDLSTIIHSRSDLQEHEWLYRRHPARESLMEPLPAPFQSASLGSQAVGSLPDLNTRYLSEILTYDLVIGPPSSLILEAAFLGMSVIVDLSRDDKFRTSSGRTKFQIRHVDDFLKIASPSVYDTPQSLAYLLSKWASGEPLNVDTSDIVRNDVSFRDALNSWLLEEFDRDS